MVSECKLSIVSAPATALRQNDVCGLLWATPLPTMIGSCLVKEINHEFSLVQPAIQDKMPQVPGGRKNTSPPSSKLLRTTPLQLLGLFQSRAPGRIAAKRRKTQFIDPVARHQVKVVLPSSCSVDLRVIMLAEASPLLRPSPASHSRASDAYIRLGLCCRDRC